MKLHRCTGRRCLTILEWPKQRCHFHAKTPTVPLQLDDRGIPLVIGGTWTKASATR